MSDGHDGRMGNPTDGPLAVVFDLFITLTDFDAERQRPSLTGELASALGIDDPVAFGALMRSTFTERASGALGDVRATLEALTARLGGSPSSAQLERAVALRMQHEEIVLTPRPGVLDVLRDLRDTGYLIGVLTDCTPELPDLWPSLPYADLVDAVTFSCSVGTRKPDPVLYHHIADQLGVDPSECLYVGDGGSQELTGATAVGMRAVLLLTPFGDDYRYDAEQAWDGVALESLQELPAFVEALR